MFRHIQALGAAAQVGLCQALVAESVAPRSLLHHAARQLRHLPLALPADQFAGLVDLKRVRNSPFVRLFRQRKRTEKMKFLNVICRVKY